jgi:hypothetical protein
MRSLRSWRLSLDALVQGIGWRFASMDGYGDRILSDPLHADVAVHHLGAGLRAVSPAKRIISL